MKKVGIGKKRGLSPVIASILLLLLVLILAVMIFLWARGFLDERVEKFGKPIEEMCEGVSLNIYRVDDAQLEVVNVGNVDVNYLDIEMKKDGNSEFGRFSSTIDKGEAVIEFVNLYMEDGITEPDEIIIYPVLIGTVSGKNSNKPFTCLNYGVSI
jgi:flagellin-like protein